MTRDHRARMRRLHARAAAYAMHAQHDSGETSRRGREAFLARFGRQVDPDGVLSDAERTRRAEAAKRAYFIRLSIKSAERGARGGPMVASDQDFAVYDGLVASWRRHLRAANKSPKTIKSYQAAATQLRAFLTETGGPGEPSAIRRRHVEEFIADLIDRTSPSTAATRYRGLQQFFKWLEEEGEIEASPLVRMRPPKVPESPVPVLGRDDLTAVLRVCEGTTFEQRRDLALLRILIDTGLRLAELTCGTTPATLT